MLEDLLASGEAIPSIDYLPWLVAVPQHTHVLDGIRPTPDIICFFSLSQHQRGVSDKIVSVLRRVGARLLDTQFSAILFVHMGVSRRIRDSEP